DVTVGSTDDGPWKFATREDRCDPGTDEPPVELERLKPDRWCRLTPGCRRRTHAVDHRTMQPCVTWCAARAEAQVERAVDGYALAAEACERVHGCEPGIPDGIGAGAVVRLKQQIE